MFNQKVDFHSHFLSPTYLEYLERFEGPEPDHFPTPKWDLESHIAQMNQLGIAVSLISVSSPNLSGADRETEKAMVRQINLEGWSYVQRYPERLGLMASLPLPHVEDAIEEASFALRDLHADGFGLSTHYAGIYLGDERYDPLMEYFNTVGAVIVVHPVQPAALPKGVNREVPIPAMEFFMDTTRTFMNMVMHDVFGRFPNIRWVFPHAGAFLSILSDRINGFSVMMRQMHPELPLDFKGDMNHVYFDVAGFPLQKQMKALLCDVKIENLLYGSDTPYTPGIACAAMAGGLEKLDYLTEEEKQQVFTGNAVRLLPRLAPILGVEADDSGSVCYQEKPLTAAERKGRRQRSMIAKLYGKVFG